MIELSSEAIDEGIDAYCTGVPRGACPYRPSIKAYYDWLTGWDEAEAIDFEDLAASITRGLAVALSKGAAGVRGRAFLFSS